jgi:hypothetical protein
MNDGTAKLSFLKRHFYCFVTFFAGINITSLGFGGCFSFAVVSF